MKGEKKMKVRATNEYQKGQIPDNELGFVPVEGYEWEVDEARYEILSNPDKNGFKKVFVKKVEEKKVEKAVKAEPKKRNAKK